MAPEKNCRPRNRASAVPKLAGTKSGGIRTKRWIDRAARLAAWNGEPLSRCLETIIDSGKTVANLCRNDYVDLRDICVRNWNRISIVSILIGGLAGAKVGRCPGDGAGRMCVRRRVPGLGLVSRD